MLQVKFGAFFFSWICCSGVLVPLLKSQELFDQL